MKLPVTHLPFIQKLSYKRDRKKSWKPAFAIIAVLILVAAGPGIYLLLKHPRSVQAVWFDNNWSFRQKIPLSNTGSAQTDFQVQLTVDTATLVTASKLLSSCADVRLTTTTGKVLPYWIEPTTCNTATTKIWVKVPSIGTATSGTTNDIYLYYGNSLATAPSNTHTTDVFVREIPNLVAAYKMDEAAWAIDCATSTVLDSSGNSNQGLSCPSSTGPAGGATGLFNNAGLFTASSSQYVYSTNSASLKTIAAEGSISVWVKYTTFDGTIRTISDVAGTGNNGLIFLGQHTSCTANRPGIQYGNGGGTSVSCATTTPSTGTWYNMIATWDSSGAKFYFNGTQQSANATAPAINITQTNMFIGSNTGTIRFLDGNLDDLQFYNKALTQAEVTDLAGTNGNQEGYNTTTYPGRTLVRKFSSSVTVGAAGTEEGGTGPIAYWKFNENGGQTVNDSTTHGIDGTLGSSSATGQTSDPTWKTSDQCVIGSCMYVDGSTNAQYANFGDVSTTKIDTKTVSFWAKPTENATIRGVVSQGGPNWYTGFDTSGRMIASYNNSSSVQVVFRSNNNVMTVNEWHFYTYVFSVSGSNVTINFYRDGQAVGTSTSSAGYSATYASGGLKVGTITTGSTNAFIGFIDEVKVFNYVRTAAQIKSDFIQDAANSGSSAIQGMALQTPLSNGLVGYWKMDEATGAGSTLADSSQNNNTGTAVLWGGGNTSTDSAHVQGKFANGFSFDGGDDYVNRPDTSSLSITGSFTAGAWVNPSGFSSQRAIIAKDASGSNRSFYIAILATGAVRALVSSDGSTITFRDSIATLSSGSWQHVMMVYNSTTATLDIYINGQLSNGALTGTVPSSIFDGNADINIGEDANLSQFFLGTMDEARIYNRALSPVEVRQLYNFAPGPSAYYKFDEQTGTNANDFSGNSNTGTLENGPTWDVGKYGSGVNLDGSNDDVSIPDTANNDFDTNQDFTVSAWIKAPATQPNVASTSNAVIEKWSGSGGYPYVIRMNNQTGGSNGKYQFARYDGTNNPVSNSTSTYNDNLFHYVTFSKSGSTLSIYFDGKLDKTFSDTTTATTTNSSALYVGKRGPSLYNFKGVVDDLKIYNYARTPSQITEDMLGSTNSFGQGGGSASLTKAASPLVYWKFDEGYGTTTNNNGSGGSIYLGTLGGTVLPTWQATGKVNKGLFFTAASDANGSRVRYNAAFNPLGTTTGDQMTFSAWIKPNATQTNGVAMFVRNGFGADESFGLYVSNLSGGKYKISVSYHDATAFQTLATTSRVVTASVWNHVVAVFTQGTNVKIYVNGQLAETIPWVGTNSVASTSSFNIGGHLGAIAQSFDGYIDEVKVYNFGLTQDQVNNDYNAGLAINYGVGATTEAANDLTDGAGNPPVAYWNLDERTGTSANDSSGNNNTGTLTSMAAPATFNSGWGQGKYGAGLNFDGVDDEVSISNGPTLSTNATIEGWFYWISGSASLLRDDTTVSGWILAFDNSGTISFRAGNSTFNTTINTAPLQNKWTHYAITKSGVNVNYYINGVLLFTSSASGSTPSVLPWHMMKNGGFAQYIKGSADEIKIYDYARTAGQVAYDYNRGGPVGWWKMDECQSTTINDQSGNSNTGTLTVGSSGTQTQAGTCNTSGTAWGNGASGKYNASLNFDGTDDYISIPSSTSLNLNIVSVSLWVKASTQVGGAFSRLIAKSDLLEGWTVQVNSGGPGVMARVDTSAAISQGNNSYSIDNVLDGSWHHVVFIFNNGNLKGYKDGNLAVNVNYQVGDGSLSNATPLAIGARSSGTVGSFFTGQIDDARLFNYVLSSNQIKKLYNDGLSVFYGPSSGSP